ncbi:MAG: hypothetical protein AB1758_28260, partial [Candidatus Eremiobacterota bacterium]
MVEFLTGIKGRLLALAVVAAFLIPITLCTIHQGNKPRLYPGDRMEKKTCRECGGVGVMRENMTEGPPPPGYPKAGDPCIGCAGKGKVWVVFPGPNHPSWVKIKIFDAAARPAGGGMEVPEGVDPAVMGEFMEDRNPMQPIPGAVKGATIRFEKGSDKVEIHSGLTGRAKVMLSPGKWSFVASKEGFRDYQGEVDVPVRTD